MGFNFRKSLKIAPGVRLNIGKKGISSVSVGGKGVRVNVGKKGTRTTVGVSGTGLSYSHNQTHRRRNTSTNQNPLLDSQIANMQVISIPLAIGIVIFPILFSWLTLRSGYTTYARILSFSWLVIYCMLLNR